ncbi:MAG: DUF1593 domain-containing protein [Bacteroidales bacterium]|nr:DUF1593 domain-containing protein [Bacteroidales bacterium]
MRTLIFSTLLLLFSLGLSAASPNAPLKPRIIVLTDIAPNDVEPDDMESMIRLLVHADLFEIEGLVASTGYNNSGGNERPDLIRDAIDAYQNDLPNLRKRSNQKAHLEDESQQRIGYWPSPDYLSSRTVIGSQKRGMKYIGKENNSPGSNLIIEMADENDARPVWVLAWGGANTLAQAIWQVRENRNEEQLQAFLDKIRVYTITDQDRGYQQRNRFDISSHQWMRREFKKDLFFIWDECAWLFQNETGRSNWDQYATHIQGHGKLGSLYPKYKYGVEGDTPSFLYVLPNEINSPEHPAWGSWGGYFEWGKGPDNETFAYINHEGTRAHSICRKYLEHFYPATFNNFAARMDWARSGDGNRNPVVIINGNNNMNNIKVRPEQGTSVTLDASESFDPDGDDLTCSWWIMAEAGTYTGEINISDNNSNRITLEVPSDAAGKSFHVICEVTDNGTHPLTGYRRIIVKPSGTVQDR